MTDFAQVFQAATGYQPYPWQCRLACGEKANPTKPETLRTSNRCTSLLIDVSTGLGKTAGVVMAWAWNRLARADAVGSAQWPRRLVYCLPMRTLVEQTRDNVQEWLRRMAAANPDDRDLAWLAKHSPVILMGGEDLDPARRNWDIYPENPCILIGTQDMLLSRALNRGYGMSRYRWPMQFGLLNNDCLWVLDETQLLGVALETSAQLEGLRHSLRFGEQGTTVASWWMSATLDAQRLATVDHPEPTGGRAHLTLDQVDHRLPAVQARFQAKKPLQPANVALSSDDKKDYAKKLSRFVVERHRPGSLTLVVVNNVARAQDVYQQIQKLEALSDPLALIHSRFRAGDRARHEAVLRASGGRVVVATQAVEAGVDVSACTLITELAPWASLVQRIGRCNRGGEFRREDARVFWVDVRPKDDADDLALPYTAEEMAEARKHLRSLDDAGPESLARVIAKEKVVIRPVLRRRDVIELFDTTPDLAGHDIDVSRYIRDGDDADVHVFWRDCGGEVPQPEEPAASRDELCRVSLPRFREFLKKLRTARSPQSAFAWNQLAERWEPAFVAQAGATYMLDVRAGGYTTALGWCGSATADASVTSLGHPDVSRASGFGDDERSFQKIWITLRDHSRRVVEETTALTGTLAPDLRNILADAARWHDVGKAHGAFQQMLTRGQPPPRTGELWAKSGGAGVRCERRFFRHELASALAWLQTAPADVDERDLIAYLIAAHHGKVRLSLRPFPGEEPPADRPDARVARGVIEGDPLGPVELDGVSLSAITLDLQPMVLGQAADGRPSWLARMIALRDRFGPFRLAWLEALLRAADARASLLDIELGTAP